MKEWVGSIRLDTKSGERLRFDGRLVLREDGWVEIHEEQLYVARSIRYDEILCAEYIPSVRVAIDLQAEYDELQQCCRQGEPERQPEPLWHIIFADGDSALFPGEMHMTDDGLLQIESASGITIIPDYRHTVVFMTTCGTSEE